ncbi:hypothetical protein IFM89_029440 [Coptis chinensis]|uniref:Protein yippee-like n=1 Tax=Coptis chinensis TaxID=261450 RepID=A0A835H7L9_9MAGN|nr:hypothetical protein IFM89_029440 [Coptis chinensis]
MLPIKRNASINQDEMGWSRGSHVERRASSNVGRYPPRVTKLMTYSVSDEDTEMDECVNVSLGENEERLMMTGMHTVADVFCVGCGSNVGWKYEAAHEKAQKYKEGKFVLEKVVSVPKMFKISGSDGSNYWVTNETRVVASDADDA